MNSEEKREYNRKAVKKWRENNPETNKMFRKKYKSSEKGIKANKKYNTSKKRKEYMNDYMKDYNKNKENHNKYLIRQRDYVKFREKVLKDEGKCMSCSSKISLEIHHEDYIGCGNIIILCRKCHKELHKQLNQRR